MDTFQRSACNCLCAVNHAAARGICEGAAATTVPMSSSLTGRWDVPMCSACAVATLDEGRVDRVTSGVVPVDWAGTHWRRFGKTGERRRQPGVQLTGGPLDGVWLDWSDTPYWLLAGEARYRLQTRTPHPMAEPVLIYTYDGVGYPA